MKKTVFGWVLLVACARVAAAPCGDGAGAEDAVRHYLGAMQNQQFEQAWDFVSAEMTDGKPREEWAALQKLFYQGGAVNILSIDVRAAQQIDNDPECAKSARVPNVLKSRDKFNNQGTTEFEIYDTVKTASGWRVNMQETLFDQAGVDQWFPGEKLPEFRDQY